MTNWLLDFFFLSPDFGIEPAVHLEKTSFSYNNLNAHITSACDSLYRSGVKEGHRVALMAKTTLSTVITFLALLKLGASPCLLSTRIPPHLLSLKIEQARASFFLDQDLLTLTKTGSLSLVFPQYILLFTSGSTKEPKLACLTSKNFLTSAKGSLSALGLTQKSCYLLNLPLFHVSGLSILFRSFLSGASFSFHPTSFITHISCVPTQLRRLLEENTFFPKLSSLLLGGAPLPEDLIKKAQKKQIPLQTTYGMTETASQITLSSLKDCLIPPHAGRILPGRELSLGKDGEILVRGEVLFSGYDSLNNPVLPLKEGWFATNDLGEFTPDHKLLVKGRKDNLFISGGENIYPEEIERALNQIPHVLTAVVVPKKDPEYGQRPLAFVHMSSTFLSQEEFKEQLSSLLPKFAIPVQFLPLPEEFTNQFKIKREEVKLLANNY